MAGIYVYAETLNQMFRDKDTGLPLAGGKIYFYQDANRSVLKPVYKQTGVPGAYTYVPYDTNPDGSIPINDYGTLSYALYLYPFDSDGNSQLYYIVVKSMMDVTQFDRAGFPLLQINDIPASTGIQSYNYISNGQFLLHDTLPAGGGKEAGEVRFSHTYVGPGNWSFVRDAETTSKDYVLFERFNEYTANPPANPRYAVNIKCEDPGSGTSVKDLRWRASDVNFLASLGGFVTFAFEGNCAAGEVDFDFIIYKNYGTGGDMPSETIVSTGTLTTEVNQFVFNFQPGTNSNASIGALDDDYVEYCIRFPTDEQFDAFATDFIIYQGYVLNPVYPQQTPQETIARCSALWEPGDFKDGAAPSFGWWLPADGRAISRTTYFILYQKIGTEFGSGDGTTTFNIPDYRGRMALASGQGSGLTDRLVGQSGGAESTNQVPAHTHTFLQGGLAQFNSTGSGPHAFTQEGASQEPTSSTGVTSVSLMNPFLVCNRFIYTGVN